MYLIAYGLYMYHMAPSEIKVKDNQKGYAEFTKRKKREYIIREADKVLTDKPRLSSREVAKKIGFSHSSLCRAFNEKTETEMKKSSKIDLSKFTDIMFKMGLGAGGIGILQNPEKLASLASDLLDEMFLNKHFVILSGGLFTFWQKFIVKKLKDPQNDLSEIEVFCKLMDSKSMYVLLSGFGLTLLIPKIILAIEDIILFIKGGGITDIVENVEDSFNMGPITINNKTFPSYLEWSVKNAVLVTLSPASAILLYKTQRAKFIRDCEREIQDKKESEEVYGPISPGTSPSGGPGGFTPQF